MAITVNTNTAANSALTKLSETSRRLNKSFERISSGLRIARAADDAAGLGVAENLKVAASSAKVAARNIGDGISMIAVAEGASAEVTSILGRMRELAVQSASETLGDDERQYIQDEYVALAQEVDRIANTTEFNGAPLADGTTTTISVQVGIHATANDVVDITMGDLRATTLGVDSGSLDLSTSAGASAALDVLDAAVESVSSYRSLMGAGENRLNSALNNLEVFIENTKAAESQIRDADFGEESAELSKMQVLQQAGVAVLAQAKQLPQSVTQLLQS
ncbi:MAG: flagellin FliC [Deltaproteobacteria bacterium]|nr:flagellin FliC [Deltaproteobacteria bacterium]